MWGLHHYMYIRSLLQCKIYQQQNKGAQYHRFVIDNYVYYMEESVLLGTKPLVDSIRHFIRDPSGVFSVWHLCECRIVQWRHDSRLLLLFNWFFVSRLFSLHTIKRTLHVGSKIWILCSCGKNNISLVRCAHSWDIVLATQTYWPLKVKLTR